MSDQNMSLQIFVPLDGFKKLNDILENIKNSLSELVNPLKEIGNHIKSIGKSSSEITQN